MAFEPGIEGRALFDGVLTKANREAPAQQSQGNNPPEKSGGTMFFTPQHISLSNPAKFTTNHQAVYKKVKTEDIKKIINLIIKK